MFMASLISNPYALCSFSLGNRGIISYSSATSHHKNPNSVCSTLNHFSKWSGLKNMGFQIDPNLRRKERRRTCKGMVVKASLFGVGAPEALVIGVVALLVFGPKGLAEVARNLGKTLRAFQPTIRELQDVSREFKSSLEREIGLDEFSSSSPSAYSSKSPEMSAPPSNVSTSSEDAATPSYPYGAPSIEGSYTSEGYLKMTEQQLKASADQLESAAKPQPQANIQETASIVEPPPQNPGT